MPNPFPPTYTEQFQVVCTPQMKEDIERMSQERGTSKAAIVREAVALFLAKQRPQN